MFDERAHNYPQGYKEEPHCPHSPLVEICNSLAGNNVTPKEFCTEEIQNARYSEGIIAWLQSADYSPRTSCSISCLKLVSQLKFVKSNTGTLPDENEVIQNINDAKNIEGKAKILDSYKDKKGKSEERKEIVSRWKKIIFDVTCSTSDDIQNSHFRRFNSPDELSEDEIIGKVEEFTETLKKLVGYKENSYLFLSDGAKNCKQSPHSHHVGN